MQLMSICVISCNVTNKRDQIVALVEFGILGFTVLLSFFKVVVVCSNYKFDWRVWSRQRDVPNACSPITNFSWNSLGSHLSAKQSLNQSLGCTTYQARDEGSAREGELFSFKSTSLAVMSISSTSKGASLLQAVVSMSPTSDVISAFISLLEEMESISVTLEPDSPSEVIIS